MGKARGAGQQPRQMVLIVFFVFASQALSRASFALRFLSCAASPPSVFTLAALGLSA